jgi:hypothetical protein
MSATLRVTLSAALALALAPHAMRGQTLNIDNFKTGSGKIGPLTTTKVTASQTGTGIVGGTRTTTLDQTGGSEFDQPSTVQFRPSSKTSVPSAMIWTNGYKAYPRIDLVYGSATSLGLNLSAYDRIRVTFNGLQQELNFNLEAWDASNVYGTCGINLSYYLTTFTVDFPLSAITGVGTVNWSNIASFDFIFQGGYDGSPNLALTSIQAIPASTPPGTVTCVAP